MSGADDTVSGLKDEELEARASEFFSDFDWEPTESSPEEMTAEAFLAGLDDDDAGS